MIATIALKSIIPVRGMIRRIGSRIGSVTWYSSRETACRCMLGNQLMSDRMSIAAIRNQMNALSAEAIVEFKPAHQVPAHVHVPPGCIR